MYILIIIIKVLLHNIGWSEVAVKITVDGDMKMRKLPVVLIVLTALFVKGQYAPVLMLSIACVFFFIGLISIFCTSQAHEGGQHTRE